MDSRGEMEIPNALEATNHYLLTQARVLEMTPSPYMHLWSHSVPCADVHASRSS